MKGDITNDKKCSLSGTSSTSSNNNNNNNNNNNKPHQKTVFIRKLYNILQDDDMKELIWWSDDGLSFHIKPNETFSKALATYFKHSNITSFVRQLNIYGFQKVNNIVDTSVLEQTNYETPTDHISKDSIITKHEEIIKIWEFKHSANLFRKGDTESLKLIKRRSSTRNSNNINNNNNNFNDRQSNDRHNSRHGSNNNPVVFNNIPPGRITPTSVQQQLLENNAYSDGRARFASNLSDQLPNFYPTIPSQLGMNMNIVGQQFRSTDSLHTLNSRSPYNSIEQNSYKHKYQDLLEQLKATNFDMVKIIDLVEKALSLSSKLSPTTKKHPNSTPTSRSGSNIHGLSEHEIIQNDIVTLRQDIINRWNENWSTYQADFQANQYMPNSNSPILVQQQPQQQPQQQQQQQQQPQPQVIPVIYKQPSVTVPQQVIAYNSYAQTPLTQQQIQQQHIVQANPPIPLTTYSPNVGFTNENMMNPFEIRNHSRNEIPHNKRNMSVLVDPLTPATSTHSSAVNFIPPVIRPIPMNKSVMQRGSSASSLSIASVIDAPKRTHDSMLRESMTINSDGDIVNSSGNNVTTTSDSKVATGLTPLSENNSKRGEGLNHYSNPQSLTPQSSISKGKSEKGFGDLQNQTNPAESFANKLTTPVENIPQDYKVRSILNDTRTEGDDSVGHVNKKIKTSE
ncbi:flocculation suppression protein [Monosporozyma servazzii]